MADLWERLRAAKQKTSSEVANSPKVDTAHSGEQAPDGWVWIDPQVARRTATFELDPRFWNQIGGVLDLSDWEGVCCFDTETTGLSGGSGTVAFLVGWAQLRGLAPSSQSPLVEVSQWFLRDFSGEAQLISHLDTSLGNSKALVSFNGASFDLPLLKSRWALQGRVFPPMPHRDDLHLSRRLWKRLLENCRLGSLESAILGMRRIDDVPGSIVPSLWFEYLRKGASADFVSPLGGVIRHHAQDVYSLLCLDLLLAAVRKSPHLSLWLSRHRALEPRPSDRIRLAPLGLQHPALGERVSVDFWGHLDLMSPDRQTSLLETAWNEEGTLALGLAWADRLKRNNDPRCVTVWEGLWRSHQSFSALEERLKWWEHREKTPSARSRALESIHEALQRPFLARQWKERLIKRRERLIRLQKGPSAGSS